MAETITLQSMMEMELHTFAQINSYLVIWRVPGGWIYINYAGQNGNAPTSSVFVPEPAPRENTTETDADHGDDDGSVQRWGPVG